MNSAQILSDKPSGKLPSIAIYADGADKATMFALNKLPHVAGFTTNPSLMKKSGVADYKQFAMELLREIKKPISFEIFADDDDAMIAQGNILAAWADNVYVKVPVINTKGAPTHKVIRVLSDVGIKLNITAIFTSKQIADLLPFLNPATPSVLSIFGGRIADTGVDPEPIVKQAADIIKASNHANAELLWAGTRQVFSAVEAARCGCQIITMPPDMIEKLSLFGKDLTDYSRDAVVNFFKDAQDSKLTLS
ncbi:MAG: transaldolase family protein [Hydrotalea sp.]|nr:transaldolase family protein [Hydrotalea sp.]